MSFAVQESLNYRLQLVGLARPCWMESVLLVGWSGTRDWVYLQFCNNDYRNCFSRWVDAPRIVYVRKSLTTPCIIYCVESLFDDMRSKFFVFFVRMFSGNTKLNSKNVNISSENPAREMILICPVVVFQLLAICSAKIFPAFIKSFWLS